MTDESLKNASVPELERLRDDEMDKLRARFEKVTDVIENEPGRWIGQHPWSATLGAAAAGFLATQLIPRSAPKRKKSKGRTRVEWEEPPQPAAPPGGQWVAMIMGMAEQFLPLIQSAILNPNGPSQDPSCPGGGEQAPPEDGIYVGDAGTTRGAAFPGFSRNGH